MTKMALKLIKPALYETNAPNNTPIAESTQNNK